MTRRFEPYPGERSAVITPDASPEEMTLTGATRRVPPHLVGSEHVDWRDVNAMGQAIIDMEEEVGWLTAGGDPGERFRIKTGDGHPTWDMAAALNVRDFGAVGDGLADDAGVINTTLAAVGAGGVAYLPPGQYFLSSKLIPASNTTLAGAGLGATTLLLPAGATFPAIELNGTSSVTVRDLSVGKKSGAILSSEGHGVRIIGPCLDTLVENVSGDGLVATIRLDGSVGGVVNNAAYKLQVGTNATGGTYMLGFVGPTLNDPQWTTGVAYNANAATLQAALESLPAIGSGNVAVTGTGGPGQPLTITFQGTLAGAIIATFQVNDTISGAAAALSETVHGGPTIARRVTLRRVTALNSPTNFGFWLAYADTVIMEGCHARGHWLDGVKGYQHLTNVQILGGDFSSNGVGWYTDAVNIAGDGIDIYAGGERVRIANASFNYNAGNGLQMKNDAGGNSGYTTGKFGLSRIVELDHLEAIGNTVGYGVLLLANSGDPSYIFTQTTVTGGYFAENDIGIMLDAHHVVMQGLKCRRNGNIGIYVGSRSQYVDVIGCHSTANGRGVGTGFGAVLSGKHIRLTGGSYVGAESDSAIYTTDLNTLTKFHNINISVATTASDVIVENVTEAFNTNGRGIQVTAGATDVLINQKTGILVPNVSLIHGSPGSVFTKSDATSARDVAWVKVSGLPAAVGGWARLSGPYFDVTHYGALGNGTADDLAAINLATAAATAAGGGTVFLPPGTYNVKPVSTTGWIKLSANTQLLLDPRATIKVDPTSGNFQAVIGAPTEGGAVSNIVIEGGTIDLNPSGNTGGTIANVAGQVQNAVRFTNFDGVTVRGVRFNPCCGQNTIMLAGNGCKNAYVLDNYLKFSVRGTAGYDSSAIYVEALGHVIRGNIGETTVADKARGFIESHNGKGVVEGNTCDGWWTLCNVVTGAFADAISENFSITGNTAYRASKGITLWSTTGKTLRGVSITGNTLSLAQVTHDHSQSWGITVSVNSGMDGSIEGLTIADNTISFEADTRTTSSEGAISAFNNMGIKVGGRGIVTGLSIDGNTVIRSSAAGIRVGETGFAGNVVTNADISGNVLTDCGYNANLTAAYRAPLYLDGDLKNVHAHDNPIYDSGTPSARAGNSIRANFTMGTCTQVFIHDNPVNSVSALAATLDRTKVSDLTGSISLDFPSMPAGNTAVLTVSVLGAVTTDVAYASPAGGLEGGLSIRTYVSAADTVTVQLCNHTAGAVDPAARTWYVGIMKRTV